MPPISRGGIKLDANVAGNFSSEVPSSRCLVWVCVAMIPGFRKQLKQDTLPNCTCCHVGMWLPVCLMAPVL